VSSLSGEEHINGSSVALSPTAVDDPAEAEPTAPAPDPAPEAADPTAAAEPDIEDVATVKAPSRPKPAKPVEPPPVADGDDEVVKRDAWRRVLAVVVVLVAALAVVVLWARPAHEPVAPPLETAAVSQLNPTDLAYLQLMISLDSSALPLFDLMKDLPELQGVAGSGADGHRAELVALRAALAAGAGVEDSSIHAGHDLPGMVLEADLAAVRDAPADQRAAKAVAALRDHLNGTIPLATSEGKAGNDPVTLATAKQIFDTHNRLLAALPA
jgi:hypothetical protein